MKKIIAKGTDTYKATCHECGAVFTYEREDVWHNYMFGGEQVSCPHCGREHRHFGALGFGSGNPKTSLSVNVMKDAQATT